MTLALSILGIVTLLLPVLIKLWNARQAKKDDPNEQNTLRKEVIAKEILVRDPERINLDVRSDLDRLSALRRDKQRPGGSPADGR